MRSSSLSVRALVVCTLLTLVTIAMSAAISIPTALPTSQTFDGMGIPATATSASSLPADFRVDALSAVRTVGTFAGAGPSAARAGGANLSATASNGIYNFGSGTTSLGGSDRAIGFLSSGSATQSGNLYAQLLNASGSTLASLQIAYDVEKYRQGTNAAGFRIQMFYSTDGSSWTSAGAPFLTSFAADPGPLNSGYATAPGDTVHVNNTLTVQIPKNVNFYLAWNYSVASSSTTTNAQALAIDNISILGVAASSTNPTGTGTASPASVTAGQPTLLTVTVTPGENPDSTALSVKADLSSITPGASAEFFQQTGPNTFTYPATVDPQTTGGNKLLPVTVSDAEGRSSSFNLPLHVISNSPVVISQVYGGGGNTNATYQNDYVELYNRTDSPVDVTGWTIQYGSATGTTWSNRQPIGGPIEAHSYYLVALASGGDTGAALPQNPNISGGINMSATAGKVALVESGDPLEGACPLDNAHVKDFVGYGTTANCFEGGARAPAPSNTTAIFRRDAGETDTDENGSDFIVDAPNARRTTPIVEIGPVVVTTDPGFNGTNVPRDGTIQISFSEPVDVTGAWFSLTCATSGQHSDATFAVNGNDRYITPNVNFVPGEQCTVTLFKDQISDSDTDDSAPNTDHLPANYIWSFRVAAAGDPPPYPADVHLTMGNPTSAVADLGQPNNYLMSKAEYALSYNRDLGRPNWVSWHLTSEWYGSLSRVDTFRPDPAVPPDWYRVQSFDFQFSGFDRGHMVPNADRDNQNRLPVNQATYLMSNMVAQAPDNNQGPWANLEGYLRTLTDAGSELYIVSGPAGSGGVGSNGGVTMTLAGGHVTVPAYTWKVALVLPKQDGDDLSRVTCSTRTIAVVMPNVQGIRTTNPNDWQGFLTTVDAVESLTGYDFFSNVTPLTQSCIEAGVNGSNPKTQTIDFAPLAPRTFGEADFPIGATASSGLNVTFTVVSGPATIVGGNMVHLTGAGAVTIRATQGGNVDVTHPETIPDAFAAAAPVDQTFAVGKGTPLFSALDTPTVEAGTADVAIGGTLSLGTLVPTGSVAVTLNGNTVNAPIGAGGHFSATLPALALTASGSPYAIQFDYGGDPNFTAAAQATSQLTVVDTTAPAMSAASATPNVVTVPNHKMFDVLVTYSATDLSGAPVCTLAVRSNEPRNGTGDGNTAADWLVLDAHHVQLRAERAGTGTGRVYTITATCRDAFGNTSSQSTTVNVPK